MFEEENLEETNLKAGFQIGFHGDLQLEVASCGLVRRCLQSGRLHPPSGSLVAQSLCFFLNLLTSSS